MAIDTASFSVSGNPVASRKAFEVFNQIETRGRAITKPEINAARADREKLLKGLANDTGATYRKTDTPTGTDERMVADSAKKASNSILNKFGKVLAESGAMDAATKIFQNARPEFMTAFNREYASQSEGDEMSRTYRAFAKLAKEPQFTDDVTTMLRQIIESFGIVNEEKVLKFIDDVLNHTEAFIADALKTVESMSPEQMQAVLAKAK